MKTITKDLLVAAKFAAKDGIRPVLASVMIDNEKMVATDSYKLIEIKHGANEAKDFPIVEGNTQVESLEKPVLIMAKDVLKKMKFTSVRGLPVLDDAVLANESEKTISLLTTDMETANALQFRKVDGQFPDYERVMPAKDKEPLVTVKLNALLLAEVLAAFESDSYAKNGIELKIYGVLDPIVIEGTEKDNLNKRAMLMPLKG